VRAVSCMYIVDRTLCRATPPNSERRGALRRRPAFEPASAPVTVALLRSGPLMEPKEDSPLMARGHLRSGQQDLPSDGQRVPTGGRHLTEIDCRCTATLSRRSRPRLGYGAGNIEHGIRAYLWSVEPSTGLLRWREVAGAKLRSCAGAVKCRGGHRGVCRSGCRWCG
jgi:hypothetical protein